MSGSMRAKVPIGVQFGTIAATLAFATIGVLGLAIYSITSDPFALAGTGTAVLLIAPASLWATVRLKSWKVFAASCFAWAVAAVWCVVAYQRILGQLD